MKRASRAPSELSESLHQRLNMYALAAGAAGVGVLALTPPAEARIVYTPAHVLIGKPFLLDLNHDGIVDFCLSTHYSHFGDSHYLAAGQGLGSNSHGPFCSDRFETNAIRAIDSMGTYVGLALRSGAKIQHGDRFVRGVFLGGVRGISFSSTRWFGPWLDEGKGIKNRYLGLKFKIKGRFHFGWARLTVTTTTNSFTATLTGYAYETIPNKPIIAGKTKGPDVTLEPGSLGALAAGAAKFGH